MKSVILFLLLLSIESYGDITPDFTCLRTFSILSDTIISNASVNKKIINNVIESGDLPAKEKVEQIESFTKYGFKNLFSAFHYNPAIPYSSQINPHAELFMSDYLTSHSAGLLKMKTYAIPYFNLIDHIFSEYGLPVELKYLAVIESSLQSKATSRVGAAGPWQFMPETGRRYGLKINSQVDERRDYFKSTYAAARFLLQLYNEFNDWLLVIAAYNGGKGRVYDAIKKSRSTNFWKMQYYLPEESRNHVKKFIATHYVMESNQNGFNNKSNPSVYVSLTPQEEASLVIKNISGKYNAKVIADVLKMSIKDFEKYNNDFDETIMNKGSVDLRLPEEKMKMFVEKKYEILQRCIDSILKENESPSISNNSSSTQ